ncbi:MAG: tetratricopeptide repeat protein, partial [Persicimonas sp.]
MNETRPSIFCRCVTMLYCLALAAPAVAQENGESEAAGAEQTSEDELASAHEYEKLWELEKAASLYERFAETAAPKRSELDDDGSARLEEALRKAARFRELLGDREQAVENHETYLKHLGDEEPAGADKALFAIARLYEEMGEHKKALAQYERILKYFEDSSEYDAILEARAAIAEHHHQQDDAASRKRALAEFREVLDAYDSVPLDDQAQLSRGRDAAARAKFRLAEELYDEMARITIGDASADELDALMREKMRAAEKAQRVLEDVLNFRRPHWAIAALYKIAMQYEDFANTVRHTPPPEKLNAEQKKTYRGLLEDRAQTIETKAVFGYKKALDVARDVNWFNSYAKKAAERLTALDPEAFPDMSETLGHRRHSGTGFDPPGFSAPLVPEPSPM